MHTINRVLTKVSHAIYKFFYVFATLTFSLLLVMLLVNVISRNLFSGAIAWIEESSRFVFTWMMFLGISIGVYNKKHLGVEFIVAHYPPKVRKAVSIFSDLLMLTLFIILAIYGTKYSIKTINMRSPIMNIRYGMVYACVPFGSILSSFYCLVELFNKVFGDDLNEAKEEKK